MSETCDRCHSVGEDRRTIRMECFYAMETLIPDLSRELLFSASDDADMVPAQPGTKIKLQCGTSLAISPPTFTTTAELFPHQQYTLRVCKRCRAEWLHAVQAWFVASPLGNDDDADTPTPYAGCGSGIFVRRNGITVEITQEEWDRMFTQANVAPSVLID